MEFPHNFRDHAQVKQAGILKGGILIEFDGDGSSRTESDLIAATVNGKKRGDKIEVWVFRGKERLPMTLPIQ